MVRALCVAAVLVGFTVGCERVEPLTDAGALEPDSGAPDAGLPPLELDFVAVPLPRAAQRLGLLSDGTTLYATSTIGSVAAGTLQSVAVASGDRGATWEVRSVNPPSLAAAFDGGVYALGPQALLRSSDGARTFTVAGALPDGGATATLTVTGDGALWLTSRFAPFSLHRSSDEGASFAALPLPADTTRLTPCTSGSARWAAVRDGTELLASDGVTVDSLGGAFALTGPATCLVTATGTVLVTGDVGSAYRTFRRAAGSTQWVADAADGFYRYAAHGPLLVRALTSGRVDVSGDDGATWTTRVGAAPAGVLIGDVVVAETTVISLTPSGTARLLDGAAAWEHRFDPGLPPGARPIDLSFARESSAAALLVSEDLQRTVYVAEDGVTWKRGRTLPAGAATTLALSPAGDQVFLGALDGTYRVLADAGTEVVIDSRIETLGGTRERNPVRQAVWDRAGGTFIIVTTANDADTDGSVWQLNPDTGARDWVERRPLMTTTAPAVRRGGYHALAMASDGPGLTRSMVVAMRSNVSANSYLNYLFTWQPVFDASGWWLQDTPPVGLVPATSASINGAWGGGLAVAWPGGQLQVGPLAGALREVRLPANSGDALAVRFSRDRRLWVLTEGGLWRSREPL